MNDKLKEKYLSHRGRGFSEFELTESSIKNACEYNSPYIEIDTRVSQDGKIYVYHNNKTNNDLTQQLYISKTHSRVIDKIKYKNDEPFLTLEQCIKVFKELSNKEQKLCIDIKDYGFEKEHYELVQKYEMMDQVVFVSWIPQSLTKIHKIDPSVPLILSHWNFKSMRKLEKLIPSLLKQCKFKFGNFVFLGQKHFNSDLKNLSHGYQHSIYLSDIPEKLLNVLKLSNGGICVHKSVMSKELVSYCKEKKIKIMVFSIMNETEYKKYYDIEEAVAIFCDVKL